MAEDMNIVALVGRLTRDIEIRYAPSGLAIGRISIANNYRTKKGEEWVEETNFFNVTLFGRMAEALSSYLVKGQQISLTGRLKHETWESEGQKQSRVSVIAEKISLLGTRRDGSSNGPQQSPHYESTPSSAYTEGSNASRQTPDAGVEEPFDQDIPF